MFFHKNGKSEPGSCVCTFRDMTIRFVTFSCWQPCCTLTFNIYIRDTYRLQTGTPLSIRRSPPLLR